MAYQESGKHRASRIQLDYYKNSSSIDRIKHRLAWIFFLLQRLFLRRRNWGEGHLKLKVGERLVGNLFQTPCPQMRTGG